MNELQSIILKALDEVEELRQKDAENGGNLDYECRLAAANIAELAGFPDRVSWIDLLKADEGTKYHKRYYNGAFHV